MLTPCWLNMQASTSLCKLAQCTSQPQPCPFRRSPFIIETWHIGSQLILLLQLLITTDQDGCRLPVQRATPDVVHDRYQAQHDVVPRSSQPALVIFHRPCDVEQTAACHATWRSRSCPLVCYWGWSRSLPARGRLPRHSTSQACHERSPSCHTLQAHWQLYHIHENTTTNTTTLQYYTVHKPAARYHNTGTNTHENTTAINLLPLQLLLQPKRSASTESKEVTPTPKNIRAEVVTKKRYDTSVLSFDVT